MKRVSCLYLVITELNVIQRHTHSEIQCRDPLHQDDNVALRLHAFPEDKATSPLHEQLGVHRFLDLWDLLWAC